MTLDEIRARIKELQQQRREGGDRATINAELAQLRDTEDIAWRVSRGLAPCFTAAEPNGERR